MSEKIYLKRGAKVLDITWTLTQGNERKLVVTRFNEKRDKVVLFYEFPFDPYCYCFVEDMEKVAHVAKKFDPNFKLTELNRAEIISSDGRHVAKLEVWLPRWITLIRNVLWFGNESGRFYTDGAYKIKLLEADVKFGRRVFIDMKLKIYAKQKVGYVDIETDPRERSGILDVTNPPFRMLSVAIVSEDYGVQWKCCRNEHELFDWYAKQLDNFSVVASWTNYDVKYPLGRARRIGFRNYNKFRIPSIDLMSSFSYYSRLASTRGSTRYVSLKEACRRLEIPMADYGAKEDIKLIWKWFMDYLETGDGTLEKYNVEDSQKIFDIDKKLFLTSGHLDMGTYLDILIPDTVSNNYAIDILGLRMAFNNKPQIVLPCKPITYMTRDEVKKRGGTGGGHSGGAVLKPKPGTHKWTVCFDFKSLYPSTMRALNIGIDTIDPNGDIKTSTCTFSSKNRSILVKVLDVIGKWKGDLNVMYDSAQPGTFEKFRAYTRRRVAKTLYCAVIGVMGSLICRFFNKPVAEAVTTSGRECIYETARYGETELGLDPVYGDTDSVFMDMPVNTKEEALAYAQEVAKKLNINIRRFGLKKYGVPIDIDIEPDFIGDIFYLSPGDAKTRKKGKGVKKKYVLHCVWEKKWCDYVMIVGFELKRRDWTGLAKTVQQRCFDLILEGKDKNTIIHELDPFLTELKDKLYSGKIDSKEIIFTKGITRPLNEYKAVQKGHRPPPHVAAAIKAAKQGFLDPREVSYVVASYDHKLSKTGKKLSSRQMVVEPVLEKVPEITPSGYDYYWLKQVMPILDRLDLAMSKAELEEEESKRKVRQVQFFLMENL